MAENVSDYFACKGDNDPKQTSKCSYSSQKCVPLQRYIEELKSENVAWRELYQEQKRNYKEVFQRLNENPLKLDWKPCTDLLNEEEKEFLNSKPDYKRIKRDIISLLEMQTYCNDTVVETATILDRIASMTNLQKKHVEQCIIKHSLS